MIHDSFPTHGNSKKPNLSEKRLAPVAQCKLQRRMLTLATGLQLCTMHAKSVAALPVGCSGSAPRFLPNSLHNQRVLYLGASLASIAASSPIAVRTITSSLQSVRSLACCCPERLTSVLAILNEELVDLVANLTIGNLDIVLGGAILSHEGEETVVSNVKLCVRG